MTAESLREGKTQHPWERRPGESPQAFADFEEFLHQGETRTYTRTSQARRKAYSLIRRYAKRFDWPERARAWDNFHTRDFEEERRSARREFAQRQEEEAYQLWRLGLALVYRFVQRAPDSGEWKIDPKLAPKDALALLKFVSDLLGRISPHPEQAEEGDGVLALTWGTPPDPKGDTGPEPTHPGLRRLLGLAPAAAVETADEERKA